jgi:hypothetical protein
MEEKMVMVEQNLKVAHEEHKSYANKGRTPREFKVGKNIFLKVKAKKSSLKLASYTKLAARLCGPFEILDRIGLVAYMLAFLLA